MVSTGSTSTLQRKLNAARAAAPGGGRAALRALRLALARAADEILDLPLTVIGAIQGRSSHEDLERLLSDDRLLLVLDGPEALTGALSLDHDAVAALIQHQTMGKVTDAAPAARVFTETDAALAAPLVDAMLSKAADLAEKQADKSCLTGYRFGARAEDTRGLILALDAERYRTFDLTLEFCGGVRQGALSLILPEAPEIAPGTEAEAGRALPEGPQLGQAIGVVRAELMAVMCRLRVPLDALTAMQPGETLPLIGDRLTETELVTISGQKIATGRLGQCGGMRAVRLGEVGPPRQGALTASSKFAPSVAPSSPGRRELPRPPDAPAPADPARPRTAGVAADAPRQTPPKPGTGAAAARESAGKQEDTDFSRLSPEEAAAEISQLAGLPQPPDSEAEDAPD